MKEKAKVCAVLPMMETVFTPFPEEQKELLVELEKKCNVEIVTKESVQARKDTLDWSLQRDPNASITSNKNNEIFDFLEKNKTELDGLIIFPDSIIDKRFFLTDLPTLFVDTFPNLQLGFKDATALGKQYNTNYTTATFNSMNTDVSESVGKARETDLTEKVELFNAIRQIKNTKIMDVQVKGCGTEPHEHWWRLDQEEYLKALKQTTGMDVVIVDYRDLFKESQKADEEEARNIASKWMNEAKLTNAIKNKRTAEKVTEDEVVKAAKLYLAEKKIMEEEGCNAITVDATTWAAPVGKEFAKTIGEEYLISSSLPLTEFRLHGIPTCCQSDMEGLVTQIVGEALTNRPGFHGDFIIDPFNQIAQIGHCNAPLNPYGDERRVGYSIGGEKERRPQVYVDLPQEGPVTVFKINLLQKKISLWGGELVPGESIYKNFFEAYCCTKLVVQTDAQRMYGHYNYRVFGNHNCLFYGDYREKMKTFAKLIGFQVIEQDR